MQTWTTLTHWHWYGMGLFFLLMELLGGGGFLLWIGISAAVVGTVLYLFPQMSWAWQWTIFGIFTIVAAVSWWFYLQKKPIQTDIPTLNRRSEQYIGREFFLEEAIVNGRGRLRVEDGLWRVSGQDLPKGTKVRVIGVDGVILKVEAV